MADQALVEVDQGLAVVGQLPEAAPLVEDMLQL